MLKPFNKLTGHTRRVVVVLIVKKNGKILRQLCDKLWSTNKYEKRQSTYDPVEDCIW